MIEYGAHLLDYDVARTWRMANNGSGDYIDRLMLDLDRYTIEGFPHKAGYASQTNSPTSLSLYGDTLTVSARCGDSFGYIGGYMDGNGQSLIPPSWWFKTGTETYSQVENGSNWQTGLFWDATVDGSGNHWFSGYFNNGSYDRPYAWKHNVSNPKVLPISTFTSGQAMGIDSSLDCAGFLSGSGSAHPILWTYNAGTDTYSITDVTGSSDWPSGRLGHLIGLTDHNGSDTSSPYAVGRMDAGPSATNPAKTFVYSTGGNIRFLDAAYGDPCQVSNETLNATEPRVSFAGNSPLPYIWIGSPSPSDTWNGAPLDIWAFLDPDQTAYSASVPTVITGINRNFTFGGMNLGEDGDNVWITKANSAWHVVSGMSATRTLSKGSLESGSSLDSLEYVDGKFCRIDNGARDSGADVIVEVDSVVSGAATTVAFRGTFNMPSSAVAAVKVLLWNNTDHTWDEVKSVGSNLTHWQTVTYKTTNLTDYVDGSHTVKARFTMRASLVPSSTSWAIDFEQAMVLWK